MASPEHRFFGYKHWTLEETARCFYVGRGLKGRAYACDHRNHKWHAIVKRFGLRVEVCTETMTNDVVNAWEVENIAKEGTFTTNHSHDDPNDIGCNLTHGGDGMSGYRHTSRAKISISHAVTGRAMSQLTRARLRLSQPNRQPVTQYTLDGHVVAQFVSVSVATQATGVTNISLCARREAKSAGGFIWRYAGDEFSPKTRSCRGVNVRTQAKLAKGSK